MKTATVRELCNEFPRIEAWGGRVFTMEEVASMRADELAEDLG